MSRFSTVFALCLTLAGCGGQQSTDPTTAADQSSDALKRKKKCTSNSDCKEIEFCDTEAQASCSSIGVCNPRGINLFCAQIWIGVCGCDGKTYGNDCLMHKAGVAKAYDGKCQSPACQSNDDCGQLEYCEFAAGQCGGDGACTSRGPSLYCVQTYTPVCGCDGTTYTNSCYAQKAGVSIASDGECAPPAQACNSAADCTGALPKIACRQCGPNGEEGCPGWDCVAGACQINLCSF